MNIRKSLAALALAGAILSPVASSVARAANYITNFGSTPPPSSIIQTANSDVTETYQRAVLFNSSSSFQLTEISIALASSNGYSPTNFSIGLYASDGSTPTGPALASATGLTVTTGTQSAANLSVNTFTSATANASALFSYTANAGNYALVFAGASATRFYLSSALSAPTANGSLSYVGMAVDTNFNRTAWSSTGDRTYIAIGTTSPSSPSSVPDAGNSAAGLGLAMSGLHLLRRRLPAVLKR